MFLSKREVRAIRNQIWQREIDRYHSRSGFFLDLLEMSMSQRWNIIVLQRGVSRARKQLRDERMYEMQATVLRRAKRLKEQGYIEIERKAEGIQAKLTETGMSHALLEAIKLPGKQLTAGERCFISYDIPEGARDVRDRVRWLLQQAEFKQFHKSLWYRDEDVSEIMKVYIREAGLSDWVKVFLATQIS